MKSTPARTVETAIRNRTRVIEMLAVLFTGAGKFLFVDWLGYKLWFILAAILGSDRPPVTMHYGAGSF